MNSASFNSFNPRKPADVRFGVRQDPARTLADVLEKFLQGYDRRVPEHGQFPAGYEVPFRYRGHQTVFKVGGFLSDPEFYDRRYFEVRVETPSGNSNRREWLFRGTKSELRQALEAPDAADKIRNHLEAAVDTLKDKKYS